MNVSYDRQHELGLLVPHNATIVGCGGTGTWVAIFLAMTGCRRLVLYDNDIVEPHNLNRLPFPPESIGEPKVKALTEFIYGIRPNCLIEANQCLVDEFNIDLLELPVFDCTDNLHTQKLIFSSYPTRIRVGYNGGYNITATLREPARWSLDNQPEGYEITPSWACSAAIAGALGVALLEIPTLPNPSEAVIELQKLYTSINRSA